MKQRETQAVVVIHGVGEQRPMETLRNFVRAVWTTDPEMMHPYARANAEQVTWSKPESGAGSFELRRITTIKNRNGVPTDFYELYWAHLMRGTSLPQVVGWIFSLWRRNPFRLGTGTYRFMVVTLWMALSAMILGVAALVAFVREPGSDVGVGFAAASVMVAALSWAAREIVGDAARYLTPTPSNVAARHAIREAGVELLERLHARGYGRIVVVGHSLGAVIGYDVLTHAWARTNAACPSAATATLTKLEALTEELGSAERAEDEEARRRAYRDLQRAFCREHSAHGGAWRVSDFVTMGNPLAHATLLLAQRSADFEERCRERELPTCPPVLETVRQNGSSRRAFSYGASERRLHHAAVFGPTRWTNLFFPSGGFFLRGDFVGGPLGRCLGRGILDVPVETRHRFGLLTHNHYWTMEADDPPGRHVLALRAALDLADDPPKHDARGVEASLVGERA